ncbi:unnamed protein product [Alternaria alternata]
MRKESSQGRAVDLTKQSGITTEDLIAAVGSADLALAATPRLMLEYDSLNNKETLRHSKPLEPWLIDLSSSGVNLNLNLNSSSTSLALTNPHRHTVDPYFSLLADTDSLTNIWNASTVLNNSDPFLSSMESQVTESSAMTGPNSIPEHAFPSSGWLLWPHGQTQNTPPLVRHSMQTLLCVIKTWPRMLAKGFQTPPILHHTHTNPKTILRPMQDCTFITKAWSSQTVHDTETVRDAILHSMRSLFSTYRTLDERNLLAALQALTIYAVMLMYPACSQSSVSLVDPSIFLCMQKVVSYVARTGLMLTEERDNIRPSWESWIHVTSKRRAVFSLYLLHWSYAVYHNIESFECSQLGFMPAPPPKFLWQSWSPQEWQSLYESWLEQWHGAPYMMCEFAAIQAGPILDHRTEIWLEDADELGILFFGIGTTVHPCVNGGDSDKVY